FDRPRPPGTRPVVRSRLAVAAAVAAVSARPRALGTRAARACRARMVRGRGVVGREHGRIAGMPVGMRRGTPLATALAALLGRTALARVAAVGIAMAGRAGVDALGYVPGAERGRIAIGQRLGTLGLALLERLLRLLGGLLAAHRQPAVRLLAAAPAALLAHVVEAPQFASFVGDVVAVDVALRAVVAGDMQGGLGGPPLPDHRQQRERRRRAFLELERLAQCLDLGGRQFHRLPAQQGLRQRHLAVADALEAADLAALRLPQPAHLAVAAFLEQHLEPLVRIGAADAADLVERRRAVLRRHAAAQAVDDLLRHAVL